MLLVFFRTIPLPKFWKALALRCGFRMQAQIELQERAAFLKRKQHFVVSSCYRLFSEPLAV